VSFDPNTLLASLLVSSIGFVLYKYCRSQKRFPHAAVGAVMLVYPYAVTNIPLMLGLCVVLCAGLWAVVRFTTL
jgi:hypothetical protein